MENRRTLNRERTEKETRAFRKTEKSRGSRKDIERNRKKSRGSLSRYIEKDIRTLY